MILTVLFCLFPSIGCAEPKDYHPNKADMYWLTQNIYHEARGDGVFSMIMVGYVTLQRLDNGKWGNTIKKVVTSKKQFSWYWDGKSDIPKDELYWDASKSAAMIAITLHKITGYQGVIYYHDSKVNPKWRFAFEQLGRVGSHVVYKEVD